MSNHCRCGELASATCIDPTFGNRAPHFGVGPSTMTDASRPARLYLIQRRAVSFWPAGRARPPSVTAVTPCGRDQGDTASAIDDRAIVNPGSLSDRFWSNGPVEFSHRLDLFALRAQGPPD